MYVVVKCMYVPEISSACYIYRWISTYDLCDTVIRAYPWTLNADTYTEAASTAEVM